ncbi:MAG: hypothetical protein R2865_12520 [Deinococcales bacterium]
MVEEASRQPSFYPHETGLSWEYLPNGASLDADRLFQRIEGPKVINGEIYIVTRSAGRGTDTSSFRQYRDDGVYFAREEGPGYILSLNPPIKEFPASADLRVGQSWEGQSEAHITFTETGASRKDVNFITQYRYTVVDKRQVRLEAGQFEVYVINLESRRLVEGQEAEVLHQEVWFSPFVGEVRNEADQVLIATTAKP